MAIPEKQLSRKPRGGEKPKQGGGPSLWVQLAAAFGVFLVLSFGYSFVRQYISTQDESIPLSQIAQDITAGTITSLEISGDKITAIYADPSNTSGQAKTKTSRKESESSLVQTLSD